MISVIKWIILVISIFCAFATDEITIENKYTNLHLALQKGDKIKAKFLLNNFAKDDKEQLIEFLMKEYEYQYTSLHYASQNGYEEIVKLLLNTFNQNDKIKLHEYLMKENNDKNTALHRASQYGYESIVILLLHAFNEPTNEKVIKYVMKKNKEQKTALHYASEKGHEKIVKILLKSFGKKKKEKLIEYLMQEDKHKNTVLHLAAYKGYERIVNSLLNIFDKTDQNKLNEYLIKENTYKKTALNIATKEKHEKITNCLLNIFGKEEEEKLMKEDKEKEKSLHIASKNYHNINELRKCEYCNKPWPTPTKTKVKGKEISLCNSCYQCWYTRGKLIPPAERSLRAPQKYWRNACQKILRKNEKINQDNEKHLSNTLQKTNPEKTNYATRLLAQNNNSQSFKKVIVSSDEEGKASSFNSKVFLFIEELKRGSKLLEKKNAHKNLINTLQKENTNKENYTTRLLAQKNGSQFLKKVLPCSDEDGNASSLNSEEFFFISDGDESVAHDVQFIRSTGSNNGKLKHEITMLEKKNSEKYLINNSQKINPEKRRNSLPRLLKKKKTFLVFDLCEESSTDDEEGNSGKVKREITILQKGKRKYATKLSSQKNSSKAFQEDDDFKPYEEFSHDEDSESDSVSCIGSIKSGKLKHESKMLQKENTFLLTQKKGSESVKKECDSDFESDKEFSDAKHSVSNDVKFIDGKQKRKRGKQNGISYKPLLHKTSKNEKEERKRIEENEFALADFFGEMFKQY